MKKVAKKEDECCGLIPVIVIFCLIAGLLAIPIYHKISSLFNPVQYECYINDEHDNTVVSIDEIFSNDTVSYTILEQNTDGVTQLQSTRYMDDFKDLYKTKDNMCVGFHALKMLLIQQDNVKYLKKQLDKMRDGLSILNDIKVGQCFIKENSPTVIIKVTKVSDDQVEYKWVDSDDKDNAIGTNTRWKDDFVEYYVVRDKNCSGFIKTEKSLPKVKGC